MRATKEKKLILNTSNSNSNCFTSILKTITCSSNLPSPTPSDHHHHHHILPIFKSNGYIHPNPNESPKSEPTSTNPHFLDHDPRQPGLVARLMGLESMPNSRDLNMNLRSKSLNSLHLYIFPDTFMDHVSPSPSFSHHQRRQSCHRRALSSSPILCVEPSPSEEKLESCASKPEKRRKKVDRENERITSKKIDKKGLVKQRRTEIGGFENKVVARKCRVNEDQRTKRRFSQRDDPRKEIKYTAFDTKLKKEKEVCKIDHCCESKDGSTRTRRRRSSTKLIMVDQKHGNANKGLIQDHIQEQNSTGYDQGKEIEDREELMARVIRLTEEHVRDDEWINFDKRVKELGVDFAREMLQVLISQLLDDLFE